MMKSNNCNILRKSWNQAPLMKRPKPSSYPNLALSNAIKELEQEMDLQLLVRPEVWGLLTNEGREF